MNPKKIWFSKYKPSNEQLEELGQYTAVNDLAAIEINNEKDLKEVIEELKIIINPRVGAVIFGVFHPLFRNAMFTDPYFQFVELKETWTVKSQVDTRTIYEHIRFVTTKPVIK